MSKTIIVSNRLPVKITEEDGKLLFKPSEGGLATGLGSIYKEGDNIWIGWPGMSVDDPAQIREIDTELKKNSMKPVYLTDQEISDYYEGFCNETIWPNFHYFNQYTIYNDHFWDVYCEVNKKFCEQVVAAADPDDTIWIHDYQLMLLPRLIREQRPNASIGFFLHIPFPSYESFRLLPWRREILKGMLGSDVVGFHTYDDMRHFLSSVSRLAGIGNNHGVIETDNRKIMVDAFPMGIDYEKYASSASLPETLERQKRYSSQMSAEKIILSIDRLDYSKGIPQRLRAFELFLERYPEWRERVSLVMVVVPSRDQVGKYKELKEEVDLLVGRINGSYGRVSWTPIYYFYRSFPLSALSAFYRMAHVALVTPLRDGMNLVCKEYIASKLDKKGVLILSEMAGSAKELSDAILINPNDINKLVSSINRALTMPEAEQIRHMDVMQASLRRFNIHHWVNLFMDRLRLQQEEQKGIATRQLSEKMKEALVEDYQKATQRLLFLDYDGTLSHFVDDPEDAKPDQELLDIIKQLCDQENTKVVIISGRGRKSLSEWLGHFPVDIISEHGVWLRKHGEDWEPIVDMQNNWKEEMSKVMMQYVNRTPGSSIEEKDYSLVWHYRKVETGLGELRTRELASHLKYLAANRNLQVLEGDMVVEVKSSEVNKGKAAYRWLKQNPADFIFAVGDDWTDEDTFKAMPKTAYTIKVGGTSSAARFNVQGVDEVRDLLSRLK